MKKYVKWAAFFAVLGVCGGVFYREFSKFHGVDNQFSILGLVHPHFLVLGVLFLLVMGLVSQHVHPQGKLPDAGLICYSVGTTGAGVMLFVRGILDVLSKADETFEVGRAVNGMVSGISGLFHIVLGVGLVMIFVSWLKAMPSED